MFGAVLCGGVVSRIPVCGAEVSRLVVCGVVVGTAVVYGCVVDMCGVWCQVLWCVGVLHGVGGGAVRVHCSPVVGCGASWVNKISARGTAGHN